MRSKLFVVALALFGVVAVLSLWDLSTPEEYLPVVRDTYRIERDDYGVPTIAGNNDADVAYGVAIAHAEDDFETIQHQYLAVRARLGSVAGESGARLDFLALALDVRATVAEQYKQQLSPATQAYVEAYADGLNKYAAEHPEKVLRGDLFPITGRDVVATFVLSSPLFYGLDRSIGALVSGNIPMLESNIEPEDMGSNAFAVSPLLTDDGTTHLVANSHQPWNGPFAWYELRVKAKDGWRFAGATFPGAPLPLHGHNAHLGWANTINAPDLIDVYRLDVNADETQYRFGNEWLALQKKRVWLRVKFGPITIPVPRTLYRSIHGPVFQNKHGFFAVRYPKMRDVRQVEQYLSLAKAEDWTTWIAAMQMQAVPATNFIYADRKGNIAMVYNAAFPHRNPGYDWRGILPGEDPNTLWTDIVEFDQVPVLRNPPTGYIVNANNTPFLATAESANLKKSDYADELGIEEKVTNRIVRALKLFEAHDSINARNLEAIKYDTGYEPSSPIGRMFTTILESDATGSTQSEALELLRSWDWSLDGRGSADAIAALILSDLNRIIRGNQGVLDPEAVLTRASRFLLERFGRLDASLGDVIRLRRGSVDLPLTGGPDALRAIGWEEAIDGQLEADFGDSFLMFVEWDSEGRVSSRSVQPFGSAVSDSMSPHFNDQSQLFSRQELKIVDF